LAFSKRLFTSSKFFTLFSMVSLRGMVGPP
jgi:hypothetical protein